MKYDAYFTNPFLDLLPEYIFKSMLSTDSAFTDLNQALKAGNLFASADGLYLLKTIERLQKTNPDLANILIGLESASRIKSVAEIQEIPDYFEHMTISKNECKVIGCAFAQAVYSIYHDKLDETWT